jgi:hypothetical protein
MLRKLTALALALAALTAVGALSAGAALANGELVAEEYPATLDGTDVAAQQNAFTVFETPVECADSSYGGEAVGGGDLEEAVEAFTAVPGYNNPKCKAEELKATVKVHSCDYVVHLGEELKAGEYAATVDLVCPKEKAIEIITYLSPTNENLVGCTVTIAGQTGLSGAAVTTSSGVLLLEGALTGLAAAEEGLCGEESTSKGEYDLSIEFGGTDSGEGPNALSLEDKEKAETEEEAKTAAERPIVAESYPFSLVGTETGEGNANGLTAFGASVRCPGSTYTGHEPNTTPHEAIGARTNAITLTPHYNNEECEASTVLGLKKATVNTNGCDYALTLGETTGGVEGTYGVTADIVCPEEAGPIQVTLYNSSPGTEASEETVICNITVGPQTVSGAHATDTGNGHVDITGTFTGIHLERSGACLLDGKGSTTTEGELHVDWTLEGLNEEEEEDPISLSDE